MKQYTSREFIKICTANGFYYNRTNGSHSIYINNEGKHITIPANLESVIARRLIKENNLETDIKKLKRKMTNDNYPPGAADDSNAPYNEPLDTTHKRFVSVTISYYDEVQLSKDASEEQIREALRDHVYNGKFPDKFDIDEFVVIDD